jgi:hypothetical protein
MEIYFEDLRVRLRSALCSNLYSGVSQLAVILAPTKSRQYMETFLDGTIGNANLCA